MKDFMPWFVIGCAWCGGMAGGVYLAMNHHPVFAVVVLLFGMSASFKRSSSDGDDEDSDRTADRDATAKPSKTGSTR